MRVLLLIFLFGLAFAKHEQYQGWKSFWVKANNQDQLKHLGSLIDVLELDFLSYASLGRDGLVLVKPQYQDVFLQAMTAYNIDVKLHSDNIKAALDQDDQKIEARRNATRGSKDIPYDNYQPLEVYDRFLDDIASQHPDIVTLVTAAYSFEGRPIRYVKISTTNFEDETKPVIVIDGTMHAREWISPPTVAYAISRLVEVPGTADSDLLDRFDWVLLPVANPDGYKYSFDSVRFWRKTRSTDSSPQSVDCPGVDGNRNFDFFWNTVGTNSNPCSDLYGGSHAFSEIETRVVRDILFEHLHRISLYMTIHSYGSMVLYSWGHDGTLSNNALALHTVGIYMADAINAVALPHFPSYVVGNAALVLWYGASGAAEDYAHYIGVPLSYTYELPGLEFGNQGFHLDPRYIAQVCYETWLGIAEGARRAGDLYVPLP